MGLQQIASYCAIVCYYVIGLPLSWLVAFKLNTGVIGLQWQAKITILGMQQKEGLHEQSSSENRLHFLQIRTTI